MPRPSAKGSAAPSWWRWRRTIAAQQYQQQVAATPPPRGGLFDSLFGPKSVFTPGSERRAGMSMPSGTFAPSACAPATASIIRSRPPPMPARFAEDEKACRASCPAAEVQLYSHRNPGEDINAGGVGQRPAALHGAAECVSLSHGARPELQLPAARRELVAGAEEHRGPHGRAGRHRGERSARPAVVAAARRCAGQADQAGSPPRRRAADRAGRRNRAAGAASCRRRRRAEEPPQARSQSHGALGRTDLLPGRAERPGGVLKNRTLRSCSWHRP